MNEMLEFTKVRELTNDYSQQKISKEDYRRLRKQLLEKIDQEMNGIKVIDDSSEQNFVEKFKSYFKSSDEEKIS